MRDNWLKMLDDDYLDTIVRHVSGDTLCVDMFVDRNAAIDYVVRVLTFIKD